MSPDPGPPDTLFGQLAERSIYEMTWEEVRAFLERSDAVIVPLGQVAQHGPHLPLAADAIQARAVCARTVARLAERGLDLLLGPTIPFGHSPTHHEFPGTVDLEPETLALVIRDVGRRLLHQGFRRQVLFCCGGGNWSAVENAAYHLHEDGVRILVLGFFEVMGVAAAPFLETPTRGELDGHAGELETACVLAAAPGLVQLEWARDYQSPVFRDLTDLPLKGFNFNEQCRAIGLWRTSEVSPDGAWGNPTLASAEKGRQILDSAADLLAAHLAQYLFDPQD